MDNHSTRTSRPVPTTRLTHYYQGRPNTVFLARYRSVGVDPAVRSA